MKNMKFDHSKLREAREEKGLSLYGMVRNLARFGFDISHQTISNWETGQSVPDCHQITELARFFGKKLEYFFTLNIHHTGVVDKAQPDH